MLESLCDKRQNADQLHWTLEEAHQFGTFLNHQLHLLVHQPPHFTGDDQQCTPQQLDDIVMNT